MSRRKPGFSLQKHSDVGWQLVKIHEQLVHISVDIGNAYALDSRQYKQINKAIQALSEVRHHLEMASSREHGPDIPLVYYANQNGGDTPWNVGDPPPAPWM